MANQTIFFVGSQSEIGHHAAPLQSDLDNVVVATPEEVLRQARPADLAVFLSEHFDRFREACCVLKERNVATLYLVDGILEWRNAWENCEVEPACPWTMRPVLSHKVACIGPSQARVLSQWGNRSKVEVVGIPRLDGLCKNKFKVPVQDSHRPFRLLVMTAKWPGFTETQVANAVRGLKDVKEFVASENEKGRSIEVIWRLTQNLDQRVGVENSLSDVTGRELASTLATIDAVITTPSTAMLEAMLANRPVAILDYNNVPHYVAAAWQITAREQIASIVGQLRSPAENKMFFQRSVLEDALACDGNSNQRLGLLATQMMELARKQVLNKQPLRFPTELLPAEYSPIGQLHHANVYSEFSEFEAHKTVELQARLAHARREIKHLQSVNTQLQSELEEAHGIFDQINQHPIAGPIVRVRQKLIDWVQRFRDRTGIETETPSTENRIAVSVARESSDVNIVDNSKNNAVTD